MSRNLLRNSSETKTILGNLLSMGNINLERKEQ